MVQIQPIPDQPAAIGEVENIRYLIISDYHAGIEAALRWERGIEIPSRATQRRNRLCQIIDSVEPDRLLVLGDLMHSIGDPGTIERRELEQLFERIPQDLPITLVKGNHDGAIESWIGPAATDNQESDNAGSLRKYTERVEIIPGAGKRINSLGICHGHTWPEPDVLNAEVICMGHEHPCIRLEDEVGGFQLKRIWLRGQLSPPVFRATGRYTEIPWVAEESDINSPHEIADTTTRTLEEHNQSVQDNLMSFNPASQDSVAQPPSLVVVPAFNTLAGGTWINVSGQTFLSPFLPDGLENGEVYLLNGTRLGPYEEI